jgi:hypothetical protein
MVKVFLKKMTPWQGKWVNLHALDLSVSVAADVMIADPTSRAFIACG